MESDYESESDCESDCERIIIIIKLIIYKKKTTYKLIKNLILFFINYYKI